MQSFKGQLRGRPTGRTLCATADRGAILTTVEYDVDPAEAAAFVTAMGELERSRRRNGGYGWGVYEDMDRPGRMVEQLARQRCRTTETAAGN